GAPAGLAECAEAANLIAERLADDGLAAVPVTSGSKGLQLYAALDGTNSPEAVLHYAKALAESVAKQHPKLLVAKMAKVLRGGKVFLDWSQNNPAKTTICPYSMRGRARPWVAAPRSWDELANGAELVQLEIGEVLDRVAEQGDLAEALFDQPGRLPR
ncbi:MAG TPA: hypothetical protein VFD94_10390, partial [Jatrophihabitans sp.]|nr:hypothetical protein [Jatrophihabitans sp.]